VEKIPDLVIFFLDQKHEGFSPLSRWQNWPDLPQDHTGANDRHPDAIWLTGKTMCGLQPWLTMCPAALCGLESDYSDAFGWPTISSAET